MNDQLQSALAQMIEKAMTGVDAATEFMVAETPEVVQQLLSWYMLWSFLKFLLGATILICVIVAWWKGPKGLGECLNPDANRWDRKYKWSLTHDKDGDAFMFFLTGLATAFVTLIGVAFASSFDWLKILIAPKIWLLEYASSLVK